MARRSLKRSPRQPWEASLGAPKEPPRWRVIPCSTHPLPTRCGPLRAFKFPTGSMCIVMQRQRYPQLWVTSEHACAQQEVTGEEEPEEKPKAALGGLFGRAKKAAQEATGEAQPEKKPAKAAGGLFGRARKATEEAIDEIESEPKPRPFAALLGGTRKVALTHSGQAAMHCHDCVMRSC